MILKGGQIGMVLACKAFVSKVPPCAMMKWHNAKYFTQVFWPCVISLFHKGNIACISLARGLLHRFTELEYSGTSRGECSDRYHHRRFGLDANLSIWRIIIPSRANMARRLDGVPAISRECVVVESKLPSAEIVSDRISNSYLCLDRVR